MEIFAVICTDPRLEEPGVELFKRWEHAEVAEQLLVAAGVDPVDVEVRPLPLNGRCPTLSNLEPEEG